MTHNILLTQARILITATSQVPNSIETRVVKIESNVKGWGTLYFFSEDRVGSEKKYMIVCTHTPSYN